MTQKQVTDTSVVGKMGSGVAGGGPELTTLCEICGNAPSILLHPTRTVEIECPEHSKHAVNLLVCRKCHALP